MSEFHITIGATPKGGVNIEHDLRMLKVALLYADRVKLCSVSSLIVKKMNDIEALSPKDRIEFVLPFARAAGISEEVVETLRQLEEIISSPRSLRRKMPPEIRSNFQELKRQHGNLVIDLTSKVKQMAEDGGVEGLETALRSGLVELHQFSDHNDSDVVVREYFEVVADSVAGGKTYPLFDDLTGNLVRLGIGEGAVNVSDGALNRSRHVGLAADLLMRLPAFEAATVDEILEIRKALERPLVRFRSGIIEFSESISHAPWDEDFDQDAEDVFRGRVEPAVLEIEDAINSDPFLQELTGNLLNKPLLASTTSGLGLLMASLNDFPQIWATGVGLAAGVALTAWAAARERRERHQEIENRQMYFYYRSGDRLKKKAR